MVLAEPFFVYSISLENSENFKKEIFYQHAWIKLNQNVYGINEFANNLSQLFVSVFRACYIKKLFQPTDIYM
jgi:hypothetical protein